MAPRGLGTLTVSNSLALADTHYTSGDVQGNRVEYAPKVVERVVCIAACLEGRQMRRVVSPLVAWLSRNIVLRLMLRTHTFPCNARAPREVRPDVTAAAGMSRKTLEARLHELAGRAAPALRDGEGRRPPLPVMHAFFGPLRPLIALRLLAAHTRHHAAIGLARLRYGDARPHGASPCPVPHPRCRAPSASVDRDHANRAARPLLAGIDDAKEQLERAELHLADVGQLALLAHDVAVHSRAVA